MRFKVALGGIGTVFGLLIFAAIPKDVMHTRCLQAEGEDGGGFYYRFVTRDDLTLRLADEKGLICIRVKFRRQWGFETIIDD